MNYPEKANEEVEGYAQKMVKAFQDQFGGALIGHFHIFMQEGTINTPDGPEKTSHTIVLHYVPEENDTDSNMLRVIRDLADWMTKRETDERGFKP